MRKWRVLSSRRQCDSQAPARRNPAPATRQTVNHQMNMAQPAINANDPSANILTEYRFNTGKSFFMPRPYQRELKSVN
jgi:hypothetical protein